MEQRNIIRSGSREEICQLANSFVLAVDLGFSKSRRSCGLAWKNGQSDETQVRQSTFGDCVNEVWEFLKPHRKAVLIVEAPLSGLFNEEGNPVGRGDFEQPAPQSTRYWYSGPGATMCLAAAFFLRKLVHSLLENPDETLPREVILYEGFITFKSETTDHAADARELVNSFFCTPCPIASMQASSGHLVLPILHVIGHAAGESVAPAIILPRDDRA